MMGRKKLMVLGGGRHQVPLIQRAESRGIAVVLIDYLADAPGRDIATYPLLQDALDPELAIVAGKKYAVDGVITTGTDMPVVTMARVAEALDLPCYVTPESAVRATDKVRMHATFERAGVSRVWQREIGPDSRICPDDIHLPAVVKPADSQGQRGVLRVDRPDGLVPAVETSRRYSRTGRVIVEEFIEGPEITASAWVQNGDIALLAVNDRITYNPPPHLGVAFQHVHPSANVTDRLESIRYQLRKIATAYGMTDGPLYAQMIVAQDATTVVESAARVGGGHENALFPIIFGDQVEDRLIDLALTGQCQPFQYDMSDADELVHASVTFILGRAGIAAEMTDFAELPEDIVEANWYVGPGTELSDVTNSLGRIGYFIALANGRSELQQVVRDFYQNLEVRSATGENLVLLPDETFLNT